MAKTVCIESKKDGTTIVVDGNKIHDVISYQLSEDDSGIKLLIQLNVTGSLTTRIE